MLRHPGPPITCPERSSHQRKTKTKRKKKKKKKELLQKPVTNERAVSSRRLNFSRYNAQRRHFAPPGPQSPRRTSDQQQTPVLKGSAPTSNESEGTRRSSYPSRRPHTDEATFVHGTKGLVTATEGYTVGPRGIPAPDTRGGWGGIGTGAAGTYERHRRQRCAEVLISHTESTLVAARVVPLCVLVILSDTG